MRYTLLPICSISFALVGYLVGVHDQSRTDRKVLQELTQELAWKGPANQVYTNRPQDRFEIRFYNWKGSIPPVPVGKLIFHNGLVRFQGNVAESAKAFARKVPDVCEAALPRF